MLETIKRESRQRKAFLLSQATKSLLPNPGVGAEQDVEIDETELYPGILSEVRERLDLSSLEDEEARQKALDFLQSALQDVMLSGVDRTSIQERLGQRGDLKPLLYHVEFGDSFEFHEELGVRKSHVRDAVYEPDLFQHLVTEEDEDKAFSLYLKHHGDFSLLVQAKRRGRTLSILEAWRLYHSDVDIVQARTPLECLRAFIEKYGIPFTLGGKKGKFFFEEHIVADPEDEETLLFKGKISRDASVHQATLLRIREAEEKKIIDVGIAYLINVDRYRQDLAAHGVVVA